MPAVALNISFERSSDKCRIIIEDGILSRLGTCRDFFAGASSIALVTDDTVAEIYGQQVKRQLSRVAKTSMITFRQGEKSKNLSTCAQIASKMSQNGLDRNSLLVALGGGVVGDVVGFVASIFKRGIKCVHLPTTLLAQVDSSIGGKTGVDTDWGKNQLGTFYQPVAVLIDPCALDTLPPTELINGVAEMAKSGLILDKQLFESIERLSSFDVRALISLIPRTCKLKARIVAEDERETGVRSILNYGHTIGHALEASSHYKLSHGNCVILGMIAEGWISEKLGIFNKQDSDRQKELLARIVKKFKILAEVDAERILRYAKLDKKSTSNKMKMVLPEKIGKMHKNVDGSYLVPVEKRVVLESLRVLRREL